MRALLFLVSLCMAMPLSVQAEVLTWNCSFEERVDEDGVAMEKMLLIFKVDTISQKAYMEGNVGIVEVGFFLGDEAFSFVQDVASGAVQTTTITRDGAVVHSRNTVLFGEIVAAQHFGHCAYE